MLGPGRSSVLSRVMATGSVTSGYRLSPAPYRGAHGGTRGHTGAHGGTQGHTVPGLIFRYKTFYILDILKILFLKIQQIQQK